MRNNRIQFIAPALAAAILLGGCGSRNIVFTTGAAGDILFTVGSATADTAEFRVYYTNLQREYEQTFGSDIWTNQGNDTLGAAVRDNALARLTKVKVLNLMAEEAGISLDQNEQMLAEEAAENYAGSLNQNEKDYFALNDGELASMYGEYALADREYDQILSTVDTEISDDEARTVTCQQILIKGTDAEAKGRADAILKEIRDGMANLTGVTFDSYISEYNEGDTSEITVTRQESDTALQEAAFSLGEGKISDVIQTKEGYRILKCIKGYDAEETEQNKQQILKERQQSAFENTYDAFVQKLDYRLEDEKYEAIGLVTDPEIETDTFFTTYETYFGQEEQGSLPDRL